LQQWFHTLKILKRFPQAVVGILNSCNPVLYIKWNYYYYSKGVVFPSSSAEIIITIYGLRESKKECKDYLNFTLS